MFCGACPFISRALEAPYRDVLGVWMLCVLVFSLAWNSLGEGFLGGLSTVCSHVARASLVDDG